MFHEEKPDVPQTVDASVSPGEGKISGSTLLILMVESARLAPFEGKPQDQAIKSVIDKLSKKFDLAEHQPKIGCFGVLLLAAIGGGLLVSSLLG